MKRIRFQLAYDNRHVYPQVGGFVQRVGWYSDVWAEIVGIDNCVPGHKTLRYAWDSPRGYDTSFESLSSMHGYQRFFQFRNIVSRRQLKKLPARIIYCKDGTYGKTKDLNDRSLPGRPAFLKK